MKKWTKEDYIDLVNQIPINQDPMAVFSIRQGAAVNCETSNQFANYYYNNAFMYRYDALPVVLRNIIECRRYAKGLQDTMKFRYAAKRQKGNNDPTSKDIERLALQEEQKLDWTPPKLLNSKIDVAISMLISPERTFYAKSKNIAHKEKREREQYKLAGQYVLQQAGLAPQAEGAPQTDAELELATNNLYLPFELQMKQAIEYALYTENNWLNNVEIMAAKNLIIDDLYIVKIEVNEKNGISIRICDPMNMYFKVPQKADFSDVALWAECILVDEFQLRELDREREYKDKDFENIPCLYQAPDGTRYYSVIEFQKKGFADGKEFGTDQEQFQVWRKGKWVANTNMIFDTGIVSGLPDQPSQSDYYAFSPSIMDTDRQLMSLVQRAIPHIDQHYLWGINIQKEQAAAKVATSVINPRVIAKTADIFKISTTEVLAWGAKGLAVETEPEMGQAATRGFRFEYGGTSPAVNDYYSRQEIEEQRIRNVMGIPAGIDASQVDPNQPVFSQKLAAGGAANSLVVRSDAMNFLFERVINGIAAKIKYLVAAKRLGIIESTPYDQFFDEWAEDVIEAETESLMKTEFDFEFRQMPNEEAMADIKGALTRALDTNQITITDYIDIVLAAGNDLEKANALLKAKITVSQKQQQAAELEIAQANAKIQAEQAEIVAQRELEKIAVQGEEDRKTDDNKARLDKELQKEKIDLEHLSAHNQPKEEVEEKKPIKGSFQIIPRQYKNVPYMVAFGDDPTGLELIAPNKVAENIYTDDMGKIYIYVKDENVAAQAISAAAVILTQLETGRNVSKLPKDELKKGVEQADDLTTIATEIAQVLSEVAE